MFPLLVVVCSGVLLLFHVAAWFLSRTRAHSKLVQVTTAAGNKNKSSSQIGSRACDSCVTDISAASNLGASGNFVTSLTPESVTEAGGRRADLVAKERKWRRVWSERRDETEKALRYFDRSDVTCQNSFFSRNGTGKSAKNLEGFRQTRQDINARYSSWIILLTISDPVLDMFYNWYHHYEILNLPNTLLVVAEDMSSYKFLECVFGTNSSKVAFVKSDAVQITGGGFKSKAFGALVKKRASRIRSLLARHRSVIYSDIDTVWHVNILEDIEQIRFDRERRGLKDAQFIGFFDALIRQFCTGLMAFQWSDSTLRLMDDWHMKMAKSKRTTNQEHFNDVLCQHAEMVGASLLPVRKYMLGYQVAIAPAGSVTHVNYAIGHDFKKHILQSQGIWHDPAENSIFKSCMSHGNER